MIDLASAAREVSVKLHDALTLPAGYFLEVGGRVESQARAARSLAVSIGIALLAVFILLYMALGRLSETLVILATLPDAFVGGIVALAIAGETWNVSSLVGLIALFGIAVQNGLVLIEQTRTLVARGRPFAEALREASIGRVRPKLMTAITAIFGPTAATRSSSSWNGNRAPTRHRDDRRALYLDALHAARASELLRAGARSRCPLADHRP